MGRALVVARAFHPMGLEFAALAHFDDWFRNGMLPRFPLWHARLVAREAGDQV
jgi:hypothetical protein